MASAALEWQQSEEQIVRQLADGRLGLDIYQMRNGLAEAGLRYLESDEETDAHNNAAQQRAQLSLQGQSKAQT